MSDDMKMVGGNLVVESAPRKGTTVQARIPLGKVRVRGRAKIRLMDFAQRNLESL